MLRDLAETVETLHQEETNLAEDAEAQSVVLDTAVRRLKEILEPTVRDTRSRLSSLIEARGKFQKATALAEELDEFKKMREVAEKDLKTRSSRSKDTIVVESSEVDQFCQTVEQFLRDWKYPDLTRVTFSEEKQDLVISGKNRGSYGKGLRAISYAGFTVGLLKYCQLGRLSHPGLVILDSPLVTFRKPDVPEGEAITDDVKEAFYVALAQTPATEQVLILENEDPPMAIRDKINYIHFSKSAIGRYGFFPT